MPSYNTAIMQDFFRSSPHIDQKILIIVIALAIAIAARYLFGLAARVGKSMVQSRAVPFKYFFRDSKRSIVLNDFIFWFLKYILYLLMLYVILIQVGVSSTVYLGGLFLVGLAIVFGSRHLVQDVIHGFFLRLEGQLNVGEVLDLGEVIGRVEEVGARTTTVSTYSGERVVMPNRRIEQIGSFPRGSTKVYVDVPVPSDAGDDLKELVRSTAKKLHKQFNAIVLGSPDMLGFVRVGDDELYVRVAFNVWPQQTWVVQDEFVKRITTALQQHKIRVPSDHICVYSRVGAQRSPARTRGRRRLMRRAQ